MPLVMTPRSTNAPVYSDDCYLLIDGIALDVPVIAYTLDDHPRIEPLFRGTRHAEIIEASPWLIKPSVEGRLLTTREDWQQHGMVLRSLVPMPVLAEHLRSLISVRLPSQQLAYCRFHDPAWANRILGSMNSGEFLAWSGPITEWLVFIDGAWHAYENNIPGVPRSSGDEGWFQLREEQLARWQAEEYERFLDRAAGHFGYMKEHSDYPQQRAKVGELIQQAQGYGFGMEYQILHYLELASRFQVELAHPGWVAHFSNRAQDADTRLRQAEERLFGLSEGV